MLRSVTQGARESGGFVRLLKQNQKLGKAKSWISGEPVKPIVSHPPVPSCPLYTIMGIWGVWDH